MEKINFIKTTNKFLEYKDYLEIYNELDDEKIKVIINDYKCLIKSSLTSMIEDNISKNKQIYLDTLRFWKDFLFLFYLALFFIKEYYKSNSIIFSLGESPVKLVFIQSLFYNNLDIYNKLKIKNYPINLDFKYLPLSKLSSLLLTYIKSGNILKPFSELMIIPYSHSYIFQYNYFETIELMNSNYNSKIECNFKKYILHVNLDPLTIINSDKNIIFIDRTEGMNTLATFFYLYSKLTTFQNLTSEQKNIFFCKFSFIGFDYGPDDDYSKTINTKLINNIKSFIKTLLEIDDLVLEKIIKIKIIYYNHSKRSDLNNYLYPSIPSRPFYKGRVSLGLVYNTTSIIGLLSVPESYNLLSRCIKSYKLDDNLPDDLLTNIKQINAASVNCNFINFIIFLIFMKLKKTNEFDKLIDNIDNIDIDSFNKDRKTDIPIDKYQASIEDKQKFIDFFIDNPQIISKTIFNDEITFSYKETFNKSSLKNKYLKYKNKYLKCKNKYLFTGGEPQSKRILYLDFDETLGSFHPCYSRYCRLIDYYHLTKREDIKCLKKKLLKKYFLRPNIEIFFKKLEELKTNSKIDKIIIMSRNSDRSSFNGYFNETVGLMQEITNTDNLIDEIRTGVVVKDLSINKNDIIYIVDDKCEHVINTDNCISITPYFVYTHYNIFIDLLNKTNIDINIKCEIKVFFEKNYEKNWENIFLQYPQIPNICEYKGTDNDRIKKFDDNALLTIIDKIIKLYV